MTLIVTEHAVDRYAERIMGLDPLTLTYSDRKTIADGISKIVAPRICQGVSRLKIADAVFCIDGHTNTVVTVIPRAAHRNPRSFKGQHRRIGVPA